MSSLFFIIRWSTSSKGNGRPDINKEGTLYVGTKSSLGSVIHETGHLLGLSHEQDRKDAYGNFYGEGSWEKKAVEIRRKTDKSYGSYDPNSIMHYPGDVYKKKSAPSAGGAAAINGW